MNASLIRSGSHVPGIVAGAFRLPAGTALRYERPAPPLAALLPGYAVFDSDPRQLGGDARSWMLPSGPRIWIGLTAGPIAVSIGNRRYDPLPSAVMYGATSRAMPITTKGGVTVTIDVGPVGWARFVRVPADRIRERIVPLGDLIAPALAADLVAALLASDRDLGVKAALDGVFLRHLPPVHPDEVRIARIAAVLADPAVRDLDALVERTGIGPSALQRLCRRYFGFAPKLLMMRARFLRIVAAMLTSDEPVDHSAVPIGYHNVPHFLRDANRFLGMTPRRFAAMDLPYLRATLRARQLVQAVAPLLPADTPPV